MTQPTDQPQQPSEPYRLPDEVMATKVPADRLIIPADHVEAARRIAEAITTAVYGTGGRTT